MFAALYLEQHYHTKNVFTILRDSSHLKKNEDGQGQYVRTDYVCGLDTSVFTYRKNIKPHETTVVHYRHANHDFFEREVHLSREKMAGSYVKV